VALGCGNGKQSWAGRAEEQRQAEGKEAGRARKEKDGEEQWAGDSLGCSPRKRWKEKNPFSFISKPISI